MSEQDIYNQRAMIARGVVSAVNDNGALQTLDVQTHDGVLRSGVEVYGPWGLVSVPPDGAETVVLQVGGDPADSIALVASHASARAGGAAPGTIGIADHGGNRMLVLPGGKIEIVSATSLTLSVQGMTLTVDASGITIVGPVTLSGDLTVSGAIHGTADAAHRIA